jgi:hypothetical protein
MIDAKRHLKTNDHMRRSDSADKAATEGAPEALNTIETIPSENPNWALQTVLWAVRQGQIDDAVDQFSDQFTFNDYGLGLEFTDKGRLTDFFAKMRELYPDSLVLTDTMFRNGDHEITEWTLRATLTEPFLNGLQHRVPITLRGASIVRIEGGKITHWSDYYDGLRSRRTALTAFFTEWVEL